MNVSTKTYRWLPWAAAGVIALAVILADTYFRTRWLQVNPAQNAHRVTTMIAIDAFQDGVPANDPYWTERARALAGILLFFVIGPSLWIFSEIRNHTKPRQTGDEILKKGADWYLGVTVICFALLLLIPQTVIHGVIMPNSRESAQKNRDKDLIRSDLSALGYKAAETYYLPQELGGGSGSFKTVAAGPEGKLRPLELEDIAGVIDHSAYTYLLAPITSDSVLTIYGIGEWTGEDPHFENANGERGRIQLAVKVLPETDIIYYDRSREN